MNNQTRQAYDIDNRRAGTYTVRPGSDIQATDDEAAKQFLARYTTAMREESEPNITQQRSDDNRFEVSVDIPFPSPTISYRNMFTPT
tara:strand:+ start:1277 stop:1537 length:261 start_codon:yes stop_codon:yes gene_type:complete